jgi:hypothetical protein
MIADTIAGTTVPSTEIALLSNLKPILALLVVGGECDRPPERRKSPFDRLRPTI